MEEVRMKKAEELYAYSCGHNFGKDLSRAKGLTNFHLIEEAMDPDEFAYLAFIGLHRFHSMSAHQRNFCLCVYQQTGAHGTDALLPSATHGKCAAQHNYESVF